MQEEKELLAKIRMKDKGWYPSLKDFYEPKDVVRYYNETDRINSFNKKETSILPPDKFFTEKVFQEGLKLLNLEKIKNLKEKINYLKKEEIQLQKELDSLINKTF